MMILPEETNCGSLLCLLCDVIVIETVTLEMQSRDCLKKIFFPAGPGPVIGQLGVVAVYAGGVKLLFTSVKTRGG